MNGKKLKIAIPARGVDVTHHTPFLEALRELGAEPALVGADCEVETYDGLLLPGGADVDPMRYGQENIACGTVDPALDTLEFTVLDNFVKQRKPVFGICRGNQVINVYFGGTLIQHIETACLHRPDSEDEPYRAHVADSEEGAFTTKLYGTRFVTNSSHHQAVDRPGDGLRVVMRTDEGVVEAMAHEELPVWSVQWHPERMCFAFERSDTVDGGIVLKWFLDQCEAARNR